MKKRGQKIQPVVRKTTLCGEVSPVKVYFAEQDLVLLSLQIRPKLMLKGRAVFGFSGERAWELARILKRATAMTWSGR